MLNTLLIGFGGFLGTIARYGVSTLTYRLWGGSFPYGTLVVNIVGCFVMGLVTTAATERLLIRSDMRLFLTVSVLGGFTTFSAFGYETMSLIRSGATLSAVVNIVFTMLSCLAAVWLGCLVARQV